MIKEWENTDGAIAGGADFRVIHSLERLQTFLAPADQGFKEGAAVPMERIEVRIRRDLFGPSDRAAGVM